ncbi:MAG: aldo/keto reductase [Paracoccaceae bacterium]
MDRVKLTDEVELSRIVYGMWRLGDDADTSPAHVRAKIEACLDQGITTMDQADIYGGYMAEEIMGQALRGTDLAQRIEIVTKCDIVIDAGRHAGARAKHYDTTPEHIAASIDASLRLMGVETIDLLLIHRPDPLMDAEETGRALEDAVASGKVRAVGTSNFRPWDWELLQSACAVKLCTNQIELSVAAHAGFANGDVAFHQRLGTPLMAWSPLAGGALLDDGPLAAEVATLAAELGTDPATLAVAFLLRHPATILPVMGTNNLDRIAKLGAVMDLRLDRQDWFRLYQAGLGREVA